MVHAWGGFLLTVALGCPLIGLSPWESGTISLAAGVGWEIADATAAFPWNDPRGGDFYDVFWDAAGAAAAVWFLKQVAKAKREKERDFRIVPYWTELRDHVEVPEENRPLSKVGFMQHKDKKGGMQPALFQNGRFSYVRQDLIIKLLSMESEHP
jgi:hypothetical protein